ncbi:condensation domain-containing protein [Streptomyces sp. Y1]|uniref:Condensation domain-containing protein n=1 Tax=Streptomyces sp. Y1 TaxID=3238634 RepID=A0AB39TBI4_9ACTN
MTPHDVRPARRQISVPFAAESDGGSPTRDGGPPTRHSGPPTRDSGPLTRGQDNMIRCIRGEAPEQSNKDSVWPVPDGTSLGAGLAALRRLVERHDSLRTAFPPGPGPDGFPAAQVVHPTGALTVTVVEAGGRSDAELDALAEESGRADLAVPFDLAAPPRIRFTLLADRDRLLRLVAVVCHAGADGAATAVLIRDWHALAAGQELPPVTAPTPLEVAAAEQSTQGRRRAANSLRHWARVLTTAPQSVFADARIVGPPGDHGALLVRSTAAAGHLAAVCRRTSASPSVVLLAVFAALVAHRAGRGELVISALSANRQRAALVDHVGTLAQDALILLDAGVDDLDELIARTKSASLGAYWHSTLDAELVWQLVEDAAHLRGTRFPRQVVVNDLSLTVPAAVIDARPAPAGDPELTPLPAPTLPARLMFTILRIAGSLEFVLVTCPQVLDPAETEGFARALLAVLAAAAEGPVVPAGLPGVLGPPPCARGRDWRLVDGSWVDLAAVRGLLDATLGPHQLRLDEGRLVAELVSADPALDPAAAHRAVVAALPGRDTAMAPHHYVVRHPAPGGELVRAGSGRDQEIVARLSALT